MSIIIITSDRKVKSSLNKHPNQLLQTRLHVLHMKLPISLRKTIYNDLIDYTTLIDIPQPEVSDQ